MMMLRGGVLRHCRSLSRNASHSYVSRSSATWAMMQTRWFSETNSAEDSKQKKQQHYITTPIFYVNGSPHLGHAFSGVLADALARWHKVRGHDSVLMSGTDEHGTKVEHAAKAAIPAVGTKEFCDSVSREFQTLFDKLDVKYDKWMRTTDQQKHWPCAQSLWQRLQEEGFIYIGEHSGWYCAADETFVPESNVRLPGSDGDSVNNGPVVAESGHPVEWISETNYKFRLSAMTELLREWVDREPSPVHPANMKQYVLSLLKQKEVTADISISRPKSRLAWSIDVPGDAEHGMYVWLDALSIYLTGAGGMEPQQDTESLWPAADHIIGKDIIKFHAIYWPAFLLAAKLPLPRRIVAHGHWTVGDGVKMSKSLGNVVHPNEYMEVYGVDAFRYCMLREGSLTGDAVFSDYAMKKALNSDLANKFGNLFQRITSKALLTSSKYPQADVASLTEADRAIIRQIDGLAASCEAHFTNVDFQKGLSHMFEVVQAVNRYTQEKEPWILVKSKEPADLQRLANTMFVVMESLRIASILLQPVIPSTADLCLQRLGVPKSKRFLRHCVVDIMGTETAENELDVEALRSKKKSLFEKLK